LTFCLTIVLAYYKWSSSYSEGFSQHPILKGATRLAEGNIADILDGGLMMKGTPKCLRRSEPRRPVTTQHFSDWFVRLLLTANRL